MKQLYTVMLSLFLTSSLLSNYAALDTSFADQGFTFNSTQTPTWTSQQQTCTVVQPDGKIIVAGNAIGANPVDDKTQIALVRFNTDGSLDTTFNANGTPAFTGSAEIPATPGYLTYTVPGNYTSTEDLPYSVEISVYGIALQTDGSIIVTGNTQLNTSGYPYLFIAKFQSDGTLDTTFGVGATAGITTNSGTNVTSPASGSDPLVVFGNSGSIVFPWYDTATSYSILSQDDNKIVIAGNAGNDNPACFRFLSTGALDIVANGGSGFGPDSAPGYFTVSSYFGDEASNTSAVLALQVDTSGNIYMAGRQIGSESEAIDIPVVFQCSSSGVLSTTYGTSLPAPDPIPTAAVISTNINFIRGIFNNLVVQSNSKVVAVGTASFPSQSITDSMVIARFTADGQLDTTFGDGGYIINTLSSTGIAISMNENQQFLVTGAYGTSEYSVIYRYNNDGTLDLTFSETGYIILNEISNVILGTSTTSDGKIVLGATVDDQFGAFQLLGSNELQATIPQILLYGYNQNYFSEFLYVDNYAQVITDTTTYDATVDAVNAILTAYATDYAEQSNFNYILYLYLLKPQLVATKAELIEAYPASTSQINKFFTYLNTRIDNLSALEE